MRDKLWHDKGFVGREKKRKERLETIANTKKSKHNRPARRWD